MAAGHACTACRAAAASSSISLRSPAGTSRHISWPSAPCRIAARRATSRRWARSSSRRTRKSLWTDRLVSFQQMKIVEANFQTLPKEQVREITAAIDKAIPDDERVIALDRVLANVDKSQIVPEERRGHQSRSPDHLLQQDARGHRESRRRADLEPDQGERPEVRGQHELGSCSSTSPRTPTTCATTTTWLKATDVKGPWSPAGTLPDSFKKLPADDNWKDVKANLPGQADQRRRPCRRSSSASRRPSSFC